MNYFCTYFDINYVSRGLTLYNSLEKYAGNFSLFVLCFDQEAYDVLQKAAYKQIIPINLNDFEKGDTQLIDTKTDRNKVEYYFTCTPSLPLYIFNNFPLVKSVAYIDADMYFFNDYEKIKKEVGKSSIAIVPHNFSPGFESKEVCGIYNVGYLFFKNDREGIQCLTDWRANCISWCYDRVEDGKFADQKYLDEWPKKYKNLKIITHKGINLAPWNIGQYNIRKEGIRTLIDDDELILYHFHAFREINFGLYKPALHSYNVKISKPIRNNIYLVYKKNLNDIKKKIQVEIKNVNIKHNILRLKKNFSLFYFLKNLIAGRFI